MKQLPEWEESDFDEDYLRPTKEAEDLALFVLRLIEMTPHVTPEGDGGVRISWADTENGTFQMVIGATPEKRSYFSFIKGFKSFIASFSTDYWYKDRG